MEKQPSEELFRLIKPSCTALSGYIRTRNSNPLSSAALSNNIGDIYHTLIESLKQINRKYYHYISYEQVTIDINVAQYIWWPITQVFNLPELNDGSISGCLKIMELLICQTWIIIDDNAIPKVFPLIPYVLTAKKETSQPELKMNEDLITASVGCSRAIFDMMIIHKHCSEFFKTHQGALAHYITLLLQVPYKVKDPELVRKSIGVLQLLIFRIVEEKEHIAAISPQVISKLLKYLVENGGKRVRSYLVVEILEFMKSLLLMILNNKDFKFDENKIVNEKSKPIRTYEWITKTSENLNVFFQKLTKLYENSHNLKIKQTLLHFCESLLINCDKTLQSKSIEIFINCLVYLIGNNPSLEYDKELLLKHKSSELQLSLESTTEDIGSLFYIADQQELSSKFQSLAYNLEILIENPTKQLETSISLLAEKIINELIMMENSKLAKSNGKIKDLNIGISPYKNGFKKSTLASDSTDLTMLIKKKNLTAETIDAKQLLLFDDLLDKSVEDSLVKIFQTIGKKLQIANNVIESLLLNQGNSSLHKSLILWACNQIVIGGSSLKKPITSDPVDDFLNFDEDTSVNNIEIDEDSEIQMAENVLTMLELSQNLLNISSENPLIGSISLDTLNSAARYLGTDIETELIDYLYPVIENLASPEPKIIYHAQNTILELSNQLYDGSVEKLIQSHSDYLLDSLNLKLINISMSPHTIKVLVILIKISDGKIIGKLEDVVNSCFIILDNYYHGTTREFFLSFEEILIMIYEKYLTGYDFQVEIFNKIDDELENNNKPWGMNSKDQMFDLLDGTKKDLPEVIFKKEPKIEEFDSDDEDSNDEFGGSTQIDPEDDDHQDLSKELFKHLSPIPNNVYLFVQKITSYCLRFMQSSSINVKLQILSMMNEIIILLSTQQIELNPVLYDLWEPIIELAVKEENINLNIAGLKVIFLMFKYGGTFLAKNFIEFWEELKKNKSFQNYKRKKSFIDDNNELILKEVFPQSIDYNYCIGVNETLKEGLKISGDLCSTLMAKEIIEGCLINDYEEFGIHSDIAWYLDNSSQKFEKSKATDIIV